MAKKEYKSAIRSRRMIMNALSNLMIDKPLNKITVTDVVNEADINRGTFYAHYKDISDVVQNIVEETFAKIKNEVLDIPYNTIELPHVLLNCIQTIFESNFSFFKKIMTTSETSVSVVEVQLVKLMVDYFLLNEQKFSNMNHDEYILSIEFCAGGLVNLYRKWFLNEIPLTLNELTVKAEEIIKKIIMNG